MLNNIIEIRVVIYTKITVNYNITFNIYIYIYFQYVSTEILSITILHDEFIF